MKFFIIILTLILTACGTDNQITEVGNPTTAATAKGTLQVLGNTMDGMLASQAEGSLSALIRRQSSMAETEGDFNCTYDENQTTTTCECPLEGTMTSTFIDDGPIMIDSSTSFTNEFTMTMNNCTFEMCDESLSFNGSVDATMTGTYNFATNTADITSTMQTEQPCSGMEANEIPFGFNMTQSTAGLTVHDYSGEFCITEVVSFDNSDSFETLFDPDNVCSE